MIIALLEVALALSTGTIHDYYQYVFQWTNTVRGNDPWSLTLDGHPVDPNAYGPIHALLGYLILINPLAPKVFFALSSVAIYGLIGLSALARGWPMTWRQILLLAIAWPFSPLSIISICIFGSNDSLVALLVVLALEARDRRNGGWSGFYLGLGALLKFYPILFVPLICSGRQGVFQLRGLFTAGLTFLAGMAAAYSVWGVAVLSPLMFAAGREATGLSPIYFLMWLEKILPISSGVDMLESINAPMVVAAAVLIALHGLSARLDYKVTVLLGLLLIIFTYKIGHTQFYLPLAAAMVWTSMQSKSGQVQKLAWSFAPAIFFLSAFQMLYLASPHIPYLGEWGYLTGLWGERVRKLGPLPFSATLLWGIFNARKIIFRPWQRPEKVVW